jgi:hypothetical protein
MISFLFMPVNLLISGLKFIENIPLRKSILQNGQNSLQTDYIYFSQSRKAAKKNVLLCAFAALRENF